MRMLVMQVGIMRVLVHHRRVAVRMGVRFARRIGRRVRVPVVLVVRVPVLVLHRFVDVLVIVALGDMEPDADNHQHCRQ